MFAKIALLPPGVAELAEWDILKHVISVAAVKLFAWSTPAFALFGKVEALTGLLSRDCGGGCGLQHFQIVSHVNDDARFAFIHLHDAGDFYLRAFQGFEVGT